MTDKNLGLLQELVNKDPESYKEEFVEQFQHYLQTMKLLHLQPSQHRMDLQPFLELINFLSYVSFRYPAEAKDFADSVLSILRIQSTGLDPEVRMSFCKAVVVLRNRKVIPALDALELFFELVKCEDKILRKFIYGSIISQLKKLSNGRRYQKLCEIQKFLFAKLKDSRSIVARTAQLVLVDAYRKSFLRDEKSANAIAECCFHKISRIQIAAMKFFLGSAKDEEGIEDGSDTEDEYSKKDDQKTIKEVMCAFRAAKKTRKKLKNFEKAKKAISKEKKAKKEGRSKFCNLAAIQSLYDPHAFSERLFGQLESKRNEKFEVRLLQIALCARVIGIHKLQTLGFYSFLHRYLQPKQREVTRLLLYAAQACHELVPPDVVEQLVRTIAYNFVTDRNTPEAITVGLNAIREIFASCPFAATEELLRDLAEYKKYKNKNVSMAARGLITLFRTVNPRLLHKKDRGRPTGATVEVEVVEYGVLKPKSFVVGAECLPEVREESGSLETDENDVDSEDAWEDIPDSEFDNSVGDTEEGTAGNVKGEESKLNEEQHPEDGLDDEENGGKEEVEDSDVGNGHPAKKAPSAKAEALHFEKESASEKAKMISETRILTQDEFRKIRAYQLKKKLLTNRQIAGSKKRRNDDIKLDEELDEKIARREEGDGLPRLNDIEHFHKKFRKQTKEERLSSAREGREGREEYGKPKKRGAHVGRTNRELAKRKNYQMVRQKIRGKNRQRSFRDQQHSLRKYLLRQAGRKV